MTFDKTKPVSKYNFPHAKDVGKDKEKVFAQILDRIANNIFAAKDRLNHTRYSFAHDDFIVFHSVISFLKEQGYTVNIDQPPKELDLIISWDP